MAKTFKELKEISLGLADLIGINYNDAVQVVASFSAVGEWSSVDAIAAGDMETIKEGLRRSGVSTPNVYTDLKPQEEAQRTEPKEKPTKKKKPTKSETKLNKIKPQAVEGVRVYSEALEDYKRGELPETLTEDIKALLKAWAIDNDFDDLSKLANIQWRSACLFVGQWFKSNKILHDIEREKAEGGRVYDGEKVAALIPIWEYITGLYKHIPLHVDFIAFSGVSREWFFNYGGKGVTSSCIQIIKKVMDIEQASLTAGITDSRENPTGRIFYAKARLGWRENDAIQQIDDKPQTTAQGLPMFDD